MPRIRVEPCVRVFETYEGDHVNHIADRVEQKVLPYFSQHLSFTAKR